MPDDEGYDFTFDRNRHFYLNGISQDEDEVIKALDGDAKLIFKASYAADSSYGFELTTDDSDEIQVLNGAAGTYRVFLPYDLTVDLPEGAYKYEVIYMADDDPLTEPINLNPNKGLGETGYFKLLGILREVE